MICVYEGVEGGMRDMVCKKRRGGVVVKVCKKGREERVN